MEPAVTGSGASVFVIERSALLAATTVPVAQQGAPASPRLSVPYQTFTLPNGLNVILHEDHSVPVVSVNVWYYAGSANEKPGRTGFAHLFEHLMFEGSGPFCRPAKISANSLASPPCL